MRADFLFLRSSCLCLLVFGYCRAAASPKPLRDFQHTDGLNSVKRLLFNPLTTPIDGPVSLISTETETDPKLSIVTGEHSFIPPNFNRGDQRGPCPGLNALANHGYIARNGITDVRAKVLWCGKNQLIRCL